MILRKRYIAFANSYVCSVHVLLSIYVFGTRRSVISKNTVTPTQQMSIFAEDEERIYQDINIMDAHLPRTKLNGVEDSSIISSE